MKHSEHDRHCHGETDAWRLVINYRVWSVGCGHGRFSSLMFAFQIRTVGKPIKDAGLPASRRLRRLVAARAGRQRRKSGRVCEQIAQAAT